MLRLEGVCKRQSESERVAWKRGMDRIADAIDKSQTQKRQTETDRERTSKRQR